MSAPGGPGGVDVRLRGVVHLYRQAGSDVVALAGVDLAVGAGEMVALLGPSGMGKSTLLRMLAGVLQPSAGSVVVGGVDVARLGPAERQALRATEIGYVVQGTAGNLLPYATAAENLWFARRAAGGRRPPGLPGPADLLELLGLGDEAGRRVAELSQGARQRVALAAGVAGGPRLLLADEPTSQLEPAAAAEVVALLRQVNRTLGTTVVVVTHDPSVAGALPRTVTIRDGRVGAEGAGGAQYAVVDGSGSVQLPPELRDGHPPGTRFTVTTDGEAITLRPARPAPGPGPGEGEGR